MSPVFRCLVVTLTAWVAVVQLSKLLQHVFLALDVTMGQRCGMLTAQHVSRFTTKLASLPHMTVNKAGKVTVSAKDVLAALPVYAVGAEVVKEEPKTKRTPAPSPIPPSAEPAAEVSDSVTPVIESPDDVNAEPVESFEPMDEDTGDLDEPELVEGSEDDVADAEPEDGPAETPTV
jgi:hypothetical protein